MNEQLVLPYKIILSNKRFFQEHSLNAERAILRIGTEGNCRLRYPAEWFFEPFTIQLEQSEGKWRVVCDEHVFFVGVGVNKLFKKELVHGDSLTFILSSSQQSLFTLQFVHDYELSTKGYDLDLSWYGEKPLAIGGGESCEIQLHDPLIGQDQLKLINENGQFFVLDLHSSNGVYVNGTRISSRRQLKDYDFFSLLGFSFYYKHGHLYTDSKANMSLFGQAAKQLRAERSWTEYPRFSRNIQLVAKVPEEEISLLDPPNYVEKPKSNLLMSLIPSLLMILVIVFARGSMGGTGYVLFAVLMMSVGLLTSILTFFKQIIDHKKDSKKRIEKYKAYLATKHQKVQVERAEELEILRSRSLTVDEEIDLVESFSPKLFDRLAEDEDFLRLHLGIGQVKSERQIKYREQERYDEKDPLGELPAQFAEQYEYIQQAPVSLDLKELSMIGITGNDQKLEAYFRNLSLDLVSRHFATDLHLGYIVPPAHEASVYWARLLPHLAWKGGHMRMLACDDKSCNDFLEDLYKLLSFREANKVKTPALVIFVMKEQTIQGHPVSQYFTKAKDLGLCFIFLDNHSELLPPGCERFIALSDVDQQGKLWKTRDAAKAQAFSYNELEEGRAERLGKILAPIYSESISLENRLTKNISLFELLNIYLAEDLDIEKNWRNSRPELSLAAPLGVKVKGESLSLDIHEKAHGPHGLVAGTTGSGKSELLQTYILSAALRYHPYDLSFLIIDFKGGGMANQFKDLPHLIGSITNIEGRDIDRSLASIKAELVRRQRLFNEFEVNHIDKYIACYKRGEASVALPHLVLVVDEFAELKQEQPDFMKELISAARIGRSLGVHLILATQKPSGVVDDQIWSNSRFRICLKVQNKNDSNDVIKSPLASEIVEPGRAYISVGNEELFELFQSAYGGVPEKNDLRGDGLSFDLARVSTAGYAELVYEKKAKEQQEQMRSQQEAVVDWIVRYAEQVGISRLPAICLPALAEVIDYPEVDTTDVDVSVGIHVPIAVLDEPALQRQEIMELDLTNNHVLVVGSPQFGKTNFLQTIIRGLAERYTQEQVHLYILDFAAMSLRSFSALKHVAGVVTAQEDEKLRNLAKLLQLEMLKRKQILLDHNVSSYAAYLEAGLTELPQIVVMIDNMSNLRELYLSDNDWLLPIVRDGLGLGICIIAASTQSSGMGYKYLANFKARFALTCHDTGEYSSLFEYSRTQPSPYPGRALIKREQQLLECQVFQTFDGEREIDRVEKMLAFVSACNERLPGRQVKQIPEIPARLTEEILEESFDSAFLDGLTLNLGVNYNEVEILGLPLDRLHVLGVSGKDERRLPLLQTLLRGLLRAPEEIRVWILDDVSRQLKSFEDEDIESYSVLSDAIHPILEDWHTELAERYQILADGDTDVLSKSKLLVLFIQNKEVMSEIDKNPKSLDYLKQILDKYKAMRALIVLGQAPSENISYNAPEVLKALKEFKVMLHADVIDSFHALELPYQEIKANRRPLDKDDAYSINSGQINRFKYVSGSE